MEPRSPRNPKQEEGDYEYHYFKDNEGRLKRFRKPDQNPRRGYIRIKFIEKYYIWWRRLSFDIKLAILPWMLGFFAVWVIYQTSMLWSQNDL